jgi:hypothetical protein
MDDAPVHSGSVIAVFTARTVAPVFVPVPTFRPVANVAQPRAPPVL